MNDKFYVITGITNQTVSIINLKNCEVLTGSVYRTLVDKSRQYYGIVSSSLSKSSPFLIYLGADFVSCDIKVTIENDIPEIDFSCIKDSTKMVISPTENFQNCTCHYIPDYTYSKMIYEFCNNGRVRDNNFPMIGIINNNESCDDEDLPVTNLNEPDENNFDEYEPFGEDNCSY